MKFYVKLFVGDLRGKDFMLNMLGKILGKKSNTESEEVKCLCGEVATRVPDEIRDIYLCKKCNKLLCYSEITPSIFKVRPLSLAWLKRKY
mgnify:FL=1